MGKNVSAKVTRRILREAEKTLQDKGWKVRGDLTKLVLRKENHPAA